MSKLDSIIKDQTSRDRIVKELNKNFFVEASAGSGKTTSLVYRMVALIESGVPVDKICTITFTKAAADEFFSRFQSLLSLRSVEGKDGSEGILGEKTPESLLKCQTALNNIDLCFLGTIDAFCNMIAHELPAELDIPSDCEIISDEENTVIIKDEFENILKDTNHPLHEEAINIKQAFHKPYDAFVAVFKEVNDIRNMDIVYNKDLSLINIEDYLHDEKPLLISLIKSLISSDVQYNSPTSTKYKTLKTIFGINQIVLNEDWNNCLSSVYLMVKKLLDVDGFATSIIGSQLDADGFIEIPEKIKANTTIKYTQATTDFLNGLKTKIDEYMHALMLDFVVSITKDIAKSLKEKGKFQFTDFLIYLEDAFRKSASTDRVLVNHIFERHSHILLDESQDTNPLQTQMFFYLTGTVISDDWKKVEPKEGSLFIVGDPKQSIYSFRNANVQAYKNTREYFEQKDEVLVLTRNFRSNNCLKSWFNNTMNDVLNHGEDGLPHLDIPVDDSNDELEGTVSGVFKYSVDPKEDPTFVAKLISSMVHDKTIKGKRKNSDGTVEYYARPIEYKDFLVVPLTTDVSKLVKAFDEYNIPFTIAAKIPFNDAPSLITIKDLVYLLKDPSNRNYFTKVLYGPLFMFNDKDIIQMMNDGFGFDISSLLDQDGNPLNFNNRNHENAIKLLHGLYENVIGMSFSSTMICLLNNKELNLFKNIDTKYLEYTYFLIEKIKEGEESGAITSIKQFSDYVEGFIEGNTNDNRTLRFKEELNRVKISNLHKVKGLQAPIVILNKPSETIREPLKFTDCNQNPAKAYIAKVTGGDFGNETIVETKAFEKDKERWKAFSEAEKDRLEYVAATRAETVLIVSSSAIEQKKNTYNPWAKLVSNISDKHIIKEPDGFIVQSNIKDVELNNPGVNAECHNQSIKYHSPSDIRYDSKISNRDEIPEYQNKENAALIGTLVHKLMECIVSSRNSFKNIDLLVESILKEYGEDRYASLLKEVAEQIINKNGFVQKNSDLDKDLLNTLLSAENVWCEVPFSYCSKNGTVVSGVIDCLYEDKNHHYHIIDYKTNVEKDVSVLEKEYEDQLNSYIFALRKLGLSADAHIYHIDITE